MEPILILAQPRSGSSMTAGVFARHGVWVGSHRPGDKVNAKGHFENIPLRTFLHGEFPNVVPTATPAEPNRDMSGEIRQLIRNDGYREGPWLFKCTAMYAPAFANFNAARIGVIRPAEQILESCKKTGMLNVPDRMGIILKTQLYIRKISDVIVDSAAVAAGDFSSMKDAIEHCGLEWNENACRDFVDPALWHYSR